MIAGFQNAGFQNAGLIADFIIANNEETILH